MVTDPGPARESVSGVLGVGLGLGLIALCTLALLAFRVRSIDGHELLSEDFVVGPWPAGFAIADGLVLPTGEHVVVLTAFGAQAPPLDEVAQVDALTEVDPAAAQPDAAVGDKRARIDWSVIPGLMGRLLAVCELEAGTQPEALYLVLYPPASRKEVLRQQFRGIDWKDVSELGRKGGRIARGGGDIRWGEYSPSFVLERNFAAGTFRDSVRVNLSLPQKCWIAYAVWPPQYPGSVRPVEELLAALTVE